MTTLSSEAERLAAFVMRMQTRLGSCRESCNEYDKTAWDDYDQAAALLRRIPELEAERDQLRAELDGRWLPIESAPKDGSYILVANYAGCWIAHWAPIAASGFRFDNPWRSVMLNHDHIPSSLRSAPTRWMPLPPTTKEGDK